MVTSPGQALENAKRALNADQSELIREIENDMKARPIVNDTFTVAVRGGRYTPEVVTNVSRMYREAGWFVHFYGYWLRISNKDDE